MRSRQFKILVLGIVAVLALTFVLVSTFAKSSLENIASEALQTKVNIGSLDISLLEGSATLINVTVKNPEGFSDNDILSFPYLFASLDLKSVFSDKVIINEIKSENLRINFELNEQGSNLNALQKNIDKGEQIGDQKEAAAKSENEDGQKKVVIEALRINKSTLHASIAKQEALSIDIKDIFIQNIGEESSVTTQEAVTIVLESIVQSALRASTKISLKAGLESILQGTKDIGEGLKNIFE